MTDTLKPCPFCGSTYISVDSDFGPFGAQCDECHACGPICETIDAVADEWNTRAALSRPIDPKAEVEPVWRDGVPSKPWSDEWFIAETTYGDRVVLKALPEEWAYDFKTADDTYIKADRIKRWMQFPDSYYLPPASPSIVAPVGVKPLTKTQIETLANNIHNTDDYAYTVECLTHHLAAPALTPAEKAGVGDGQADRLAMALGRLLTAIEREPIVGDLDYPHAHNDWRGWRKKILRPTASAAKAVLYAALAAQGDDAQEGTR